MDDGLVDAQVDVSFASRDARMEAGESAQSVVLTFTGAEGQGSVTFNRTDGNRPTVRIAPGSYTLQALFKGLADGKGSTVATGSGRVNVVSSGLIGSSITLDGKVASVSIDPDTTPRLFPNVSNLGLDVRDAANNILAVRGDAADLIASDSGSLLAYNGGYTVLFEGDLSVRASTDGKTSNSVNVKSERSVVTGGAVTPNYASAVDLARWEKMPLSVRFVRTGEYRSDLESAFRQAMANWTRRTNNQVRFTDTESTTADLTVSFVTQSTLGGETIGLTTFTYKDTDAGRVHSKAKLEISSDYGTDDEVVAICAHELGHALGIEGHSPDQDLMYYRIGGIFNQRDVNTLRTAWGNDFSLLRSVRAEGPEKVATIACPKPR